ncbi:MAG: hypothetical protein M3P18_05915 [Actinomycetota bacterium]|nr:hypothetical protein [Actinomycetota bacterium]
MASFRRDCLVVVDLLVDPFRADDFVVVDLRGVRADDFFPDFRVVRFLPGEVCTAPSRAPDFSEGSSGTITI